MADEDNFDIDIYGDGEGMDEDSKEFYKQENEKNIALKDQTKVETYDEVEPDEVLSSISREVDGTKDESRQMSAGTEDQSKPQQGTKRKGDMDERRIDAGATNALMISELHWWTTEDDIRGWANDADAEDELKDLTFSEHKVNGKSKGQVFMEFASPQASTATKRKIESLANTSVSSRKFSVVFTNASSNPFKTLPKDAPARTKDERTQRSTSTSYSAPAHHHHNNNNNNNYTSGNNYRGGRGGFNNRGGYNQNYNSHRNFSNPGATGGFNTGPGFQGNMPMMNNFTNFGGRGSMMGNSMRGNMNNMRGRGGGMNNNMMPMNMMGMGMNPMMAGMGGQGFGAAALQFNAGMFNQNSNQAMNSGDWGHGAKRQRQD